MTSQPNIPRADFLRLRIDDTTPVRWRFWNVGVTMNLTGRLFRIVIYPQGNATSVLTLEDSAIKRTEGAGAGLLQWNSDENRTQLDSTGTYTGYLHELIDGRQEPRCFFTFKWLTEPPAYQEGVSLEPPEVPLNWNGSPPIAQGVSVYGSPNPGFASADEARTAVLPFGIGQFCVLNGRPAFRDGTDVYYLTQSPA